MPKDLRHQIENHLATFPERQKDVQEMQREWAEFKTTARNILLGFSVSILGIGVWVGTMETRMGNINEEVSESLEHHDQFEKRLGQLEVNNGEIRTRLNSIETTLQEIKLAIINLK